uniref:Uncharacterized protein n=1 Tax=Plectus sambesii TaxID=2011161 RepID=A0A914WM51_9BILA
MTTPAYEWGLSQRKGASRGRFLETPGRRRVYLGYAYPVPGFLETFLRRVPSLRMANVGAPGELLEVMPATVLSKHFCKPLKRSHVVGDQLYFEQRAVVSNSGKRAMRAHMDVLQTVETSRFALATELERNEAKDRMANERSRKRGYQRARKDKYPVVNSIAEIPEVMTMLWSSRFALEGDASFGQTYFIYQDDTPGFEMAVFASPDNLEKLHRSAHWVSDGNFKYRPKDMQQL